MTEDLNPSYIQSISARDVPCMWVLAEAEFKAQSRALLTSSLAVLPLKAGQRKVHETS
jgi:hypothetical protein